MKNGINQQYTFFFEPAIICIPILFIYIPRLEILSCICLVGIIGLDSHQTLKRSLRNNHKKMNKYEEKAFIPTYVQNI